MGFAGTASGGDWRPPMNSDQREEVRKYLIEIVKTAKDRYKEGSATPDEVRAAVEAAKLLI